MKTFVIALLSFTLLTGCFDAGDDNQVDAAPDASPSSPDGCSPFHPECGACGLVGESCCGGIGHAYCIDDSSCVGGPSGVCWVPTENAE